MYSLKYLRSVLYWSLGERLISFLKNSTFWSMKYNIWSLKNITSNLKSKHEIEKSVLKTAKIKMN